MRKINSANFLLFAKINVSYLTASDKKKKLNLNGKNNFAEISKNLVGYGSENNFMVPLK